MLARQSSFLGQVHVFGAEEEDWLDEFAATCAPVPHAKTPAPPPDFDDALEPRDVISDFTCCGLPLQDLHALLKHFEDAHVLGLDADGRHVHPVSRRAFDCAAPAVVFNYPRADPPPASVQTSTAPDPRAAPITLERDVTAWASESACPALSPASVWSAGAEDEGPAPCVTPELLADAPLPVLPAPQNVMKKTTPPLRRVSRVHTLPDEGHLVDGPKVSQKHKRARGGPFACSKKGCAKRYKNAGGLKYHLEKGTCVFDDEPTSPAASD